MRELSRLKSVESVEVLSVPFKQIDMSIDVRVEYGKSSVTIFEYDNGARYDIVSWDESEIEKYPKLQQKVYEYIDTAKTDPVHLISIFHGGYAEWMKTREKHTA